MADRLTGWEAGLHVYDVRPEPTRALADAGALIAPSLPELARKSEIISVMVVDDAQVRTVVGQVLPHARPGSVIAVHSTIHPATAEALAADAARRDVFLIDAPVSGGTVGAVSGRLAVLVGGERVAYERCRQPFRRFAELVVHFGPAGAGTRAKLARNLVNFVGISAALEAARLAVAAGLDLGKLSRVTTHSDGLTGGPGAIMIRGDTAPLADEDPLRPVFAHTFALGDKDLSLALALGAELGVALPLAETARRHLAGYLGLEDVAAGGPGGS